MGWKRQQGFLNFILPAIFSAAASTLFGKLFADKPETPPPPEVEKPVAMPDPMVQKAKARRKAALFSERQLGAADTVLTGRDTLG